MNGQHTLIVALDFDNLIDAEFLISKLDYKKVAIKVGSEMFTLFGPDFVRSLVARKFKVFLDLKFHDIPSTVAKSCKAAADLGVWMINVHASGGLKMLQAAKEALIPFGTNRPLLIAVTVLTSMSNDDLLSSGINKPLEQRIIELAKIAKTAGLDGVVCSALEVPLIKAQSGEDFITVTPGIRLKNDSKDDQSRSVTPEDAIKMKSDFLVIGRSITKAMNPENIVDDLLKIIKTC